MALDFSLIWLLAVAITVASVLRRPARVPIEKQHVQPSDSGRMLSILLAIYGFALLAGFIYISKFLVSSL